MVVALANPALRKQVVGDLQAQNIAVYVPGDLACLTEYLAAVEVNARPVLVLDEAFIYPDVYDECVRLRAASRAPLTVLLLVEPRTRTRWDWKGADVVLRLPLDAAHIAEQAVAALGEGQHSE